MSSTDTQAKIAEWCDRNGHMYNKIVSASRHKWPDCIVVAYGVTYYFEVKFGKDKLAPLQARTIKKLNRHDKIAFCVYSFQEFKTIIERILDGKSDSMVDGSE